MEYLEREEPSNGRIDEKRLPMLWMTPDSRQHMNIVGDIEPPKKLGHFEPEGFDRANDKEAVLALALVEWH